MLHDCILTEGAQNALARRNIVVGQVVCWVGKERDEQVVNAFHVEECGETPSARMDKEPQAQIRWISRHRGKQRWMRAGLVDSRSEWRGQYCVCLLRCDGRDHLFRDSTESGSREVSREGHWTGIQPGLGPTHPHLPRNREPRCGSGGASQCSCPWHARLHIEGDIDHPQVEHGSDERLPE